MPTTDAPRRYRVVDGHRYLVVVHGGVEGYVLRFVASCTGCFECEDGYPIGDYPTHPVFFLLRDFFGVRSDLRDVEEHITRIAKFRAAARAEGVAEGAADKARMDWLSTWRNVYVDLDTGHGYAMRWFVDDEPEQTLRAAIDTAKAEGEGGER